MQLPSFVKKTITVLHDLEKGSNETKANTFNPPSSGVLPEYARDPRVEKNLTHFRHYVGIHNDPDLNSGRPTANVGIYQRLVKAEKSYGKQYKIYSVLINSALGLQIIFAAALTALGAANGPQSAVTAFGAINTILAGFLTYLKGSHLPNRLKYYENEIVKVREYIEQREREFARGDTDLDLKEEVLRIETMYETVKRDVEINTPEAYISISNATTRDGRNPQPSLGARKRSRNDLDDRMYEYDEKMSNTRRGLESRLTDVQYGLDSRFHDTRAGFEGRINDVRHGLESRISQTRLGAESQMTGARDGLNLQYQQTREGMTSQYQHAREGVDFQLQRTRSDFENELQHTRIDASRQIDQTRAALENQYDQTRLATQAQVENTRHGIETRIQATQAQVEDTRHGLESRIDDTQRNVTTLVEQTRHGIEARLQDTQRDVTAQVEQTRHVAESKLQEVQDQVKEQEQKFLGMAESVAQKVLSVTQKMHHEHH